MSSIMKGLNTEAIDSPDFNRQIKNITRMNPAGSAAEKMILNRFLATPMVQDFNLKGHEWIDQAHEWLQTVKKDLQKKYPEADLSDLEELAHKMYEDYLARMGQLEEASKAEIRANLDQDIKDFLSKGGEIEKLKPNKVRAKPGMSMASKHIGTSGEVARKVRSRFLLGKGRNLVGIKPEVAVEGEVVSMQARKTPLVVAGSPYDWNIYDLRTNQRVANILGGDRHDIPLYEIRIKSSGMTSTKMPPTYVLRAGPNNTPPYKAYELVAPEGGFGKIEKSPGPGGTTKLHPDKDDMLRHMMKNLGGGKYYGYDLDLVEEGLNQYQLVEKALGAKIMEIDDAIELGYTDWDPNDSSSIVYLGNKKNEGYSAGAVGGAGLGEHINSPGGMGQAYRKHGSGPSGLRKKKNETAIPMFTPEDKMVNANDPGSDGWKIYSAKPSGILEGIITEYDTKTIDQVVERLPKGLTVNNFTIPAFKEYLYQKYYGIEKPNWKELVGHFAQEYRQKHGIKEYKLGDLNHFDNMLLALPKGLSAEQINLQGFKEFIYEKHGDKEWPEFKKNRFVYWDAYEKAGGSKKPGLFSKIKSSMGIDENLLNTYGDQLGLDEDVYTDSLYKEFLDSDYNKNQGSYIETLRNLGQFMRSKDMPEEKVKPLIRKLIAKLHPSGLNEELMQLAELKCWAGYTRVRGVPAGAPGSCKKKTKESSIMKGLQAEEKVDEYKEVDSQRKIEFSKENPPDLYYLYQQFIQRMLNPENTIDPNEWIDKVNKHYGLNYTWKDYQKRGHNDHTNNWQKIVDKYILKK